MCNVTVGVVGWFASVQHPVHPDREHSACCAVGLWVCCNRNRFSLKTQWPGVCSLTVGKSGSMGNMFLIIPFARVIPPVPQARERETIHGAASLLRD